MIIDNKNKIVVFLVPRTGSVTLHSLCSNQNLYRCDHIHHINFDSFMERYAPFLEDIEEYRCFAFYRDPVERAISLMKHFKRVNYITMLHYFYGNSIQISCLDRTPYKDLSVDLKDKLEKISISDFYSVKTMKELEMVPAYHQAYWLDYPIINLLDFRDYENQVKWLLNEMQIPVDVVPKLNQSISVEENDHVSDEEYAYILNLYQRDYDFFASRGIYF